MHAVTAKLCLVLALVAAPLPAQTVVLAKNTAQFKQFSVDARKVAKEMERRAKQLRLFEWEIGLRFNPLPPNARALSRIESRHRQALITLDWGKQEVREAACSVVVHELLHAKLSPLARLALLLAVSGGNAMRETVKDVEEQIVVELTKVDVWGCKG